MPVVLFSFLLQKRPKSVSDEGAVRGHGEHACMFRTPLCYGLEATTTRDS